MAIKSLLEKVKSFIKNYKYAVIVLVIGLALMLLPSGNKTDTDTFSAKQVMPEVENIETQLSALLSQIKGVGEVQLLLTLEDHGQTVYQTDQDSVFNENNQDNKIKTVIITDTDRNQSGLIKEYKTPTYKGAVVVCTGGDDPNVKFAVTQAVMRSTNLKADQICVLKMK